MAQLSDSGQAGALSQVEVTRAMIEAGKGAFLEWFSQPHLEDCLPSLPETEDIAAVATEIFASMMAARPLT